MSDKMSDLKLCPFCGGEAEFYRTPIKTNGGWCDSVVVRCKSCEARTNRVLYDANKHPNDEEYDEAAAAWNHRKPMERILERLQEETVFFEDSYGDELLGVPENIAIKIVKQEGGLNDYTSRTI